MATHAPLKDSLDAASVRELAQRVAAAWPAFAEEAFVRSATRGLAALELKARVHHVAAALREHLPDDVSQAIAIVVKTGVEHWTRDEQLSAFVAWPLIEFVGDHGLEHLDASLDALRQLTPLFTAEFAIRPFIERYPKKTLTVLRAWTRDPDEHVRRLVSEGTRPRLPWGARLRGYQRDPTQPLKLLERLKDDPSETVRRSVANHLNDVTKDHPERALEVCARWLETSTPERAWIVRHATRTLVKAGHPGALALLGYDPKAKLRVEDLRLAVPTLRLGETQTLSFVLRSTAPRPQKLVVDYAVHHVKKSGARQPKVFKLKTLTLGPREQIPVRKAHTIRPISTRVYYSGRHAIEIRINGVSRGQVEFDLRA